MTEKDIVTRFKICTPDELSNDDRELIDCAKKATERSYAPYSLFHVGAAIRLADGSIVSGANQENAAFPSGTCAERTACYYAGASHPGVPLKKIAIAAWNDAPDNKCFQKKPISPCGACRQALLEYEKMYGNIEVILYGADETYILPSIASLLPFSFTEF
jgi:cytidine deaminase